MVFGSGIHGVEGSRYRLVSLFTITTQVGIDFCHRLMMLTASSSRSIVLIYWSAYMKP